MGGPRAATPHMSRCPKHCNRHCNRGRGKVVPRLAATGVFVVHFAGPISGSGLVVTWCTRITRALALVLHRVTSPACPQLPQVPAEVLATRMAADPLSLRSQDPRPAHCKQNPNTTARTTRRHRHPRGDCRPPHPVQQQHSAARRALQQRRCRPAHQPDSGSLTT